MFVAVTMLSMFYICFLSQKFVMVKDGLLLEDNRQSQVGVLFWTTLVEGFSSVVACRDNFNLKQNYKY
jgi:hypothetical protein